MKIDEINQEILQWAKYRAAAFTTADAYDESTSVNDVKEMSDRIRKLFLLGYLARKKIDNVRYGYIVTELASDDYEKYTSPPKSVEVRQPVESILAQQAAGEINTPAPTRGTVKREKENRQTSALPQSKQETLTLLPERFSLTLQTPGGIIITITAGA